MSNAAYLRERYAERRKRGVCVDCQAASPTHVRCADCRARLKPYRARYEKEHPEVSAARMRRSYWRNPERKREQVRELYAAKKMRGECTKCPRPALDDSNYCAKHRESELQRQRDYRVRNSGHKIGRPAIKKGGARPGVTRTPPPVFYCDCGEPVADGLDCCARCAHLDGIGRSEMLGIVVSAMRGHDGMSLRELCEAVGMNSDLNNGTRHMWRYVKTLLDQGRIRRYWREEQSPHETTVGFGHSLHRAAIGCYVYALDGKTERQWKAA